MVLSYVVGEGEYMKHIVVIGGGPAGYPAALKAAGLGAKVTLIEKGALGGVCLNCGCIPSKSFLDAAHRLQIAFSSAAFCVSQGQEAAERLFAARDFSKVQARQQAVVQKLEQGISFLLKKANITVRNAQASFEDAHTLRLCTPGGEETISFDGAIIATGSSAFYPAPLDAWRGKIYDNTNFFTMEKLPQSIAVVGGGVIGCEMADFLQGFGVEVHLIEMRPRLLPAEEENASRVLTQSFAKRGIHIHTGVSASALQQTQDSFEITLSDGSSLRAGAVLVAIGRTVEAASLHLENIGVTWTRKGIAVNPQTLQVKDHIYAAGDVTGLLQLAHAATRQGEVAAINLCGGQAVYRNQWVPRAVYTSPEIASVGLSREQARVQGIAVKAHKAFFMANGRAAAQSQTEGYVEWLSEEKTGRLVGASAGGVQASELIHGAAVALSASLTVDQLREVVFAHPTFSESWAEALVR